MLSKEISFSQTVEHVTLIKNFFTPGKTVDIEEVKKSLIILIKYTKRFFAYPFATDKFRHILFLLSCETEDKAKYIKTAGIVFNSVVDMIQFMKPCNNPSSIINRISSITPFDYESMTMASHWQQQYMFEENVFLNDDNLKEFVENFYNDLLPDKMYYQFDDFAQNCATYFQNEYDIPKDQPQLKAFSSRALYRIYLEDYPIFSYLPQNDEFIRKISFLRNVTPNTLEIREKFLPKGTLDKPISECASVLYPKTVSIANRLPFLTIPDDLFYTISIMHDILSEELVGIMYEKTNKKDSLTKFRADISVGQEDIMPIILLVLILADIPNLKDINDFFNTYSVQVENNSKTGLYMANIATAVGAIMNWETNSQN